VAVDGSLGVVVAVGGGFVEGGEGFVVGGDLYVALVIFLNSIHISIIYTY